MKLTKLAKGEDENDLQFLWRIGEEVSAGKYSWNDITPYVNEQLYGDDKSKYKGESAYRKKVQAAAKFYEEVFSKFLDDEYIRELKEQKRSVEEEKVKLRDERTEYNKIHRTQARIDETLQHLEELIKDSSPYESVDVKYQGEGDNDLIICISDYHLGSESKKTFVAKEFNEDIAFERLQNYLSSILEIAYRHQSDNAYVFILGDIIDGRIKYTQALSNRMNLIEQVQQASEHISWFLAELSKYFTKVYVSSVAGNHSRLGKKEETLRDERLDDMIIWYAKAKLANINNVDFSLEQCKLDPTIACAPIRGKNWLAVHGDYDTFTSDGVGKLSLVCGFIPYGILSGHMHSTDYREISGVKYIRSGTFSSGGDYVVKQRLKGDATQAVCVVDNNGVQAFYPVALD